MAKFISIELEDGVLNGQIKIENVEVEVMIDSENEAAKMDDFKALIPHVEKFADYFTSEKQTELKEAMSKVIIDDALEQEDQKATDKDYATLQNDMTLADIYAFDGGFVLTFSSEEYFPDCDIVAQLNDDYSIDEIAVYDISDDEEEDGEE